MSSIQDHLARSNKASSSTFPLSHGPAESDSPHSPMQLDTPSPGNLDDVHPHLLQGIISEASSSSGSGNRVGAVATEYGATSVTDPKRIRQRRVMPTRLHRVSSLLAGSLEEEIAGATAKGDSAALFPGTTKVVLTTTQDRYASEIVIGNFAEKGMLYGHIRKEQIQTPEFRTRDDTEVLGKTRSMRSEEDTSDQAFERRHRKADNVEKRVRKWEKDNLKKDRLKIIERIENLKTADVRVFLPVLTAREQRHQKASATAESDSKTRTDKDQASEKPDSAQPLQDNTNLSEADSSSMGQGREAKLEQLRDDLIEEHKLILQRYDTLLTVPDDESMMNSSTSTSTNSNAVAGHKRKSLHRDENLSASARIKRSTSDSSLTSQKPRRTISVSGTFARKEGRASTAASTSSTAPGTSSSTSRQRSGLASSKSMDSLPTDPLKKPNTKYSARDKRANRVSVEQPTPRPFTDEDGKVRAENTYANIHARTSGGRFAPKNALGSSGSSSAPRSKINTKMGRQATQQRQRQRRSNATSASASKEAVVADERTDKDDPTSSAASTTKKTRRSSTSTRVQSPASEKSAPGTPNGDDSTAGQGGRTRRVKLIFSRAKEAGSDVRSGSPLPSKTSPSVSAVKREDERMDEDEKPAGEGPSRAPSAANKVTPARSALTLEEAQALLAKAMADGDDEDEVDEDTRDAADAAAWIFPHP